MTNSIYLLSTYHVSIACLLLGHPMDCSPPGSSVQGSLQARILEWVAMPFSRESSWPRDRIHVSFFSCVCRQVFFLPWAPPEKPLIYYLSFTQLSSYLTIISLSIPICNVSSTHIYQPFMYHLSYVSSFIHHLSNLFTCRSFICLSRWLTQ